MSNDPPDERAERVSSRLTSEQLEAVVRGLGASPSLGEWERARESLETLSEVTDEDLLSVFFQVHLNPQRGDRGVEVARDALRSLVELRASRRQEEQSEALVKATEALEKTIDKAAEASGALTKRLGIATIVIGVVGALIALAGACG